MTYLLQEWVLKFRAFWIDYKNSLDSNNNKRICRIWDRFDKFTESLMSLIRLIRIEDWTKLNDPGIERSAPEEESGPYQYVPRDRVRGELTLPRDHEKSGPFHLKERTKTVERDAQNVLLEYAFFCHLTVEGGGWWEHNVLRQLS